MEQLVQVGMDNALSVGLKMVDNIWNRRVTEVSGRAYPNRHQTK